MLASERVKTSNEQEWRRQAQLSILYETGRSLWSALEMTKVLESVPRAAATALQARTAILRLADAGTGELREVSRWDAGEGTAFDAADTLLAQMVRAEASPLLIADLQQDTRFVGQAGGEAAPALCAPLLHQHEVIGTLGLYGRAGGVAGEGTAFGGPDLDLLREIAALAAIAIENARLFEEARVGRARLSTLSEISRKVTGSLDLQQVFDYVVQAAVELLGLALARVWLWQEETELLSLQASAGVPDLLPYPRKAFRSGEGLVGGVFRSLQVSAVSDAGADTRYSEQEWALRVGVKSVAAVPLVLGERAVGVLSVSRRVYRPFSPDEIGLLVAFAQHAAIAIENARQFQERERVAQNSLLRLREISILNQIGMAMQGTMQLDALLQVILTGVTFGGGLGFNRAILLLTDESRRLLEGRIGVGPASGEEAARIWRALTSETRSLDAVIAERVTRRGHGEDSRFDALARSLQIPLRPTEGVLALTALEGRPFRITEARRDPRVHPRWEGRLDVEEFASVPLVARSRVIGVIAVDNKFNSKPITDEDLEFLSVFANQAGLAVESSRVYTRLEEASREIQRSHHQLLQQERLAALGEMAAHVVHEIRNPLVSIGGFARRLARQLSGREPEGHYAQIVAREVDRLERIIHDVQGMSRQLQLALEETDLHELLQDSLVLFGEKIALQGVELRLDLTQRAPILPLDPVQVKQAILNLLANALEAMAGGGILTLRTEHAKWPDGLRLKSPGESHEADARPSDDSGEEWVELSVSDTGGGIPPEILDEVFNPFFTTKEAGTGLGLSLVRRIVRAHGGRVGVENRPGHGVTFRLWLPAVVPPREGVAST
jgi:signal transduction histidine kinase